MKQSPANATTTSNRRLTIVLFLVVAAAIAIALATSRTSHGAGVRADDPTPPTPLARDSAEAPAAADAAISGEVLETLPVSKYTYLRLRGAGGEIWAAVPSTSLAIGSRVTISNAMRMDDFKSATLGRSFKIIYFGTLGAPEGAATGDVSAPKFPLGGEQDVDPDQKLPPGHPDIGGTSAPAALTEGSVSPHGGVGDSPSEAALSMPKLARAAGSNGYVVAQLASDRRKLAGQRVRVRGQVTKVTPDVQGRAFFHVRDSELSENAQDLVVTSSTTPTRGQVATFEGTLRADHNIGIGYKYPILLEDATIVNEGK